MSEGSVPSDWADRSASLLADLGFTLDHRAPDLADPGAELHVALRDRPTLRHFDPEVVAYWVPRDGRGRHAYLDRESELPRMERFAWGDVRIADRLGETNRFLVFGGQVSASRIDERLAVVCFRSEAPILRAGGHSQAVDPLEPEAGAFFGRLMIPIDFVPGTEEQLTRLDPVVLYGACLAETSARLGTRPRSNGAGAIREVVGQAVARLKSARPDAWDAGGRLLAELELGN